MATTITRSGDIGQNFTQQTVGETPNSIAVSLTAKGQAQFDIKLYYTTPDAMRVRVADELAIIIEQVKRALADAGIPLAGSTAEGR